MYRQYLHNAILTFTKFIAFMRDYRLRNTVITILLIFFSLSLSAQQLTSISEIRAVSRIYYPSTIVSDNKLDVNAFSISLGLWNNAYDFKKSYLLSSSSEVGKEGDDFFKNSSGKSKHGAFNIDVMGPSASYNLKDHYIGIYTRYRQIVKLSRVDNELFRLFNNLDENFFNNDIQQKDLSLNIHAFSEVGFSYGRQFYNLDGHNLSAGISFKYLAGASAASLYISDIEANIKDLSTINKLNGEVSVLYSDNIRVLSDAVTKGFSGIGKSIGSGLGIDLGLTHIYKGNKSDYLIKTSIAITDIGSVKYNASTTSQRLRFNADNRDLEDINRKSRETLPQYITRMERAGLVTPLNKETSFKMKLPTAFRLNTDIHLGYSVGVNADILLNMASDKSLDKHVAAYSNSFIITPRYQHKWYSAGLPLMFNSINPVSLGLVLRGGPFYVGSSSILSNLFGKAVSHADVIAGLAWYF
jgi:hypothetical protein